MLRAILNRSWRQHPTKQQLYGHLPSITKTIQVRQTRHVEHWWRSRDELISVVLLWAPSHGRAKAGRPARTYIQQLYEDTVCSPEDQPEAMNDRERWQERVSDIRALGTTRWWWLVFSLFFVQYSMRSYWGFTKFKTFISPERIFLTIQLIHLFVLNAMNNMIVSFKSSLLNLNFQISSQYNDLFTSICVISFDNGQTDSSISAKGSTSGEMW